MLSTTKRDEARAKRALYENILKEKNLVDNLKSEVYVLQQELQEYEEEKEENERNKEILGYLFESGVIDKDGKIK